jgi:hypothetical protein
MNPEILPPGKAAATLFVENKQGVILAVFDDALAVAPRSS